MSIIKTKIISPAITEKIVIRRRLNDLLEKNLSKKLIMITSPGGFGKTTTVLYYLNNNGQQYSWLHVHPEMENFYTFIEYLVESLKTLKENFGESTLEISKNYRQRYQFSKHYRTVVRDITGTLINEFLASFPDKIIIVFDDLDRIGSPIWLKIFFTEFFSSMPSNLQIFMTSRQLPAIDTSILAAKRDILKINEELLKFNINETSELLKDIYLINSSGDKIAELQKKVDGWVTGLHLVLQTYGADYDKIKLGSRFLLNDVFDFFTSDVFEKLDDEYKDFLLQTSILDFFTPSMVDEILDRNDSDQIVKELLNRNIFINQNRTNPSLNGFEVTYNYQVLFKEFLNHRLNTAKPREFIDCLYRNVFEYFNSRNDEINAIKYLLKSSDVKLAIPIITKRFIDLFEKGEYEILWNWVSNLDDSILSGNADLLFFKARLLQFYKGEIEGSLPLLEKAIKLYNDKNDIEPMFRAQIVKSRNLIYIGRANEAIDLLNNLPIKKTTNENKSRILYNLSFAYYINSHYDEGLKYLNEALTISQHEGVKKDLVNIYKLLGHINTVKGEYIKSSLYYEKVLEQTKATIDNFEIYCNLALIYAQLGNFEKARGHLLVAQHVAEKTTIPIFKIAFLLAKEAVKFESGDFEDALEILEEITNISKKINHKYYLYLSYRLTADTNYHLNLLVKAEQFYDLSFAYIDDDNILEKTEYAVMKALLLKKSSLSESIEKTILNALRYYEENNFTFNITQSQLCLADYYYKKSMYDTSLNYLAKAIKTSKEKEYYSFLRREFADAPYLYDFAMANEVEPVFIRSIQEIRLTDFNDPWISARCRERTKKNNINLYDIYLTAFGNLELKVRGEIIPETFWKKKKWKSIFIYLMTQPGFRLTRDQIIDRFFQDTAVKSAENIFRQIISHFRSLLKFTGETKKTKGRSKQIPVTAPLVLYEGKTLTLNSQLFYRIDFLEFEKLVGLIKYTNNIYEKINLSKKAVELYKGDFWEGNYETWCEELRTRYKNDYISLCENMVSNIYDLKLFDEAILYSNKLRTIDRSNTHSFEIEIKSYYETGRISLAREKMEQMNKYYKNELNEEPPRELIEKLKIILT